MDSKSVIKENLYPLITTYRPSHHPCRSPRVAVIVRPLSTQDSRRHSLAEEARHVSRLRGKSNAVQEKSEQEGYRWGVGSWQPGSNNIHNRGRQYVVLVVSKTLVSIFQVHFHSVLEENVVCDPSRDRNLYYPSRLYLLSNIGSIMILFGKLFTNICFPQHSSWILVSWCLLGHLVVPCFLSPLCSPIFPFFFYTFWPITDTSFFVCFMIAHCPFFVSLIPECYFSLFSLWSFTAHPCPFDFLMILICLRKGSFF